MENKKVLGKILPAVLVLVFALLLVITISSCSKAKKTPVGAIEDKEGYLKLDLANDETYSISKLEFYNKLRYVGYTTFEDALYEAALSDYVKDIKDDIEANSANLENSKYYKRFKYIIDKEVYGTSDQESIDDFEDDERLVNEKKYLNNIKQIGYDVDDTTNIYQKASFEYQTITLAKREYARKCLLEDVEDVDSENQITDKKIEDFFNKKVADRGDLSALLILFTSQSEIEEALMQMNLKFVGSKIYRVPASEAHYEDSANRTFKEYEDYYKDEFSATADGVSALEDNEVLFELCRIYNYVYSYRTKIKFEINGVDYLDETAHPIDPLVDSYTTSDYKAIKEFALEDMVEMLLAQDLGDIKTSPRFTYDYKTLHDMDTTLQQALNSSYSYNYDGNPRYNTPSSTFGRGNYLTFKLADGYQLSYKSLKDLVALNDNIDNKESESVIKASLETVKENYKAILKALKIFDDEAAVKAWAKDYATNVEVLGFKGAKEILASTSDKESEDSIWAQVFEEMLTDDYIKEKLEDYLDEDCKITIYDSLFEVQFAQNNDFYKAGNKQSKEYVLKVKVGDQENKITAEDMFSRLEKKYGANTSISLLANQILKEKYYDQITDDKKKEFEEEYDNIIAFFAQGKSEEYGYSASIGQKAFVNLYFQADSKDEAIFNMWATAELQNILIYENATDFKSNIYELFNTLTNVEAKDFVDLEFNLLYAYTDDDEDGEADDWTLVPDDDARKQQVMELSAQLINIINERVANEYSKSEKSNAYNSLRSKYESAARISRVGNYGTDTIPSEGFASTAEQEAFYFAQFKAQGIFLAGDISKHVDSVTSLLGIKDEAYENHLRKIYEYMIKNFDADLDSDQTIARTFELDEDGTLIGPSIDKAYEDKLFIFEKGFGTIYLQKTVKAPSFKFELSDNADTPTGSKVYPYSVDPDDPFPTETDADGKKVPKDMTDDPNTLYNSTDKVTNNQIQIYIRENKEGVESLSTSVLDAFKAYTDERIMANYLSNNFRYYISLTLINQKISEGKLTLDADLLNEIKELVDCKSAAIFNFEESALATEWYNLFK
ncbi:MAG: hypothetical protein J6Y28_00705 [Acholeplasmatales bacterium]|nr:hypothetical protein [Acholeplasmatales bacterium]